MKATALLTKASEGFLRQGSVAGHPNYPIAIVPNGIYPAGRRSVEHSFATRTGDRPDESILAC